MRANSSVYYLTALSLKMISQYGKTKTTPKAATAGDYGKRSISDENSANKAANMYMKLGRCESFFLLVGLSFAFKFFFPILYSSV
jgi:hypothetical protein